MNHTPRKTCNGLSVDKPCRRTNPNPTCQIADLVLHHPIAKGGYDPKYRPYVKLRDGGKLIDSRLDEKLLHQIGKSIAALMGYIDKWPGVTRAIIRPANWRQTPGPNAH